VAALIKSSRPELRPRDLRDILYESSDDLGATGEDDVFGFGRVNSFQAVQLAATYCPKVYTENEPTDLLICEGQTLNIAFGIAAINPTYQWFRDGQMLASQTGPALSIPAAAPADEGFYTLEVTTDCRVESIAGTMVLVNELVAIASQPASILVEPGQDAVFTITTTGDVNEYLWFHNDIALPGEIFSTLTIPSVSEDNAGAYFCWVIGFCGDLETSDQAFLTLGSPGDCLPDTNNDGVLTPTDFTAWINAFNNNLPECDQNGNGSCTPTDFTAWIANFNAGCP
ncbi:MAG: hypothetical protein COB69_07765, partial [Phycisphaera sp.]